MVPDINALEPAIEATHRRRVAGQDRRVPRAPRATAPTSTTSLIEAFAVIREAATRVIGQRHFDVQLMGGAALHFGWVAEMKTGEGKTLVSHPAGLPQRALAARACTSSPSTTTWPAATPSGWAGSTASSGSSVGLDHPRVPGVAGGEARAATTATSPTARTTRSASTTSATTWPTTLADKVQRGHNYAIVDEVDSILIDEARTPLIISGRVADAAKLYYRFASIVRSLRARRRLRGRGGQARRRAARSRASRRSRPRSASRTSTTRCSRTSCTSCTVALKAKELYKRDKDYIVQSGEVKIVDEFTGRILEGRRW